MAPLTWREVSAPTFSGVTESQRLSGQLLSNGFDSAISALDGLGKSQKDAANGELLARISSFSDPASLRTALGNGTIFQGLDRNAITPETFDRANTHARALLGDVQAGVQTDGMRLNNQNQSLVTSQLDWGNTKTREFEAARPAAVDLITQIRSAAAEGTPEGRAKAAELQRNGSAVLAAAGWTPQQINEQINGNLGTVGLGVHANSTLRSEGDAVLAHSQDSEAKKLYGSLMQQFGNDPVSAERAVRENASLDPQVAARTLGLLGSDDARALQGPDTNAAAYLLQQSLDAQMGSGTAAPLVNLVDATEGAGNYDTLYSHAQRDGAQFAGVTPSRMTLDQLSAFDNEYGAWVKDKIGYKATPMGRFQIVGDTRRQVAKEMGLSGDTVFSPEVQNAMFYHLVDKRISGPKSMEGKIAGLRAEWEGFKKVPDDKLAAAITAYQNGDRSGLAGITGGGQAAAGPTLANQPASASPGKDLFHSALEAQKSLSTEQNQALFEGTMELGNQAASLMDAMTVDGLFGDQALASTLIDPALSRESQVESVNRVRTALGPDVDLKDPELIDNINMIKDKYGMSFGQAATVIGNSLNQEPWIMRWLQGNVNVDFGKQMDALIGRVYNKDGKTKGEKMRPAMELLETARTKQNAASQISQIQEQVQQAQQRYVNLLDRVRINPTPALQKELQRAQLTYQAQLAQMEKIVTTIDQDPKIGFNAE